jgi:hypothetical protein
LVLSQPSAIVPGTLPLNGGAVNFQFAVTDNPVMQFNIPNACGQNLYTLEAKIADGTLCFDLNLFDAAGVPIPLAAGSLEKQTSASAVLLIRKPPAACNFETVQITRFTGLTHVCPGTITPLTSLVTTPDINTLNQTGLMVVQDQYQFYQFNVAPQQSYAILFNIFPPTFDPFFEFMNTFPTEFICKDTITQAVVNNNFRFRVITSGAQNQLSIGFHPFINPIHYSIQTYPVTIKNLVVGNGLPETLDSTKYNFYTIPANLGAGSQIQVIPATNVPLTLVVSANPNPTIWDADIMTKSIFGMMDGIFLPQSNNPMFASVFNTQVGNNAAAPYTIQIVGAAPNKPITPATVLPPVLVPMQMALALPLWVIVVISVSIVVLIAGVITGTYLFTKYRNKKKEEKKAQYKAVATTKSKKKESSSTTTEEEDSESTTEEEPEEDSYEERERRRRPRAPVRQSRRRRSYSYSDEDSEDEEDDYSDSS